MPRNLIQIAGAAFAELGLTPPTAVVGNASPDGVQTLALLNREGLELADVEGGWQQLRGEQTIILVPGQEAYPFPTDILYYRQGTTWNSTTRWRVMGPLSAREWERLRAGTFVASPFQRYRIFNGQVHFDPVPSLAGNVVFEYVSANWCASAAGTPQPMFMADTDVPVLPDDLFVLGLKWRLLAARGMNYAEERSAYDRALERKRPRSETAGPLPLNGRGPRFGWMGNPVVPDGNWPGR